jgi:hypothetical protein
MTENAEIQIKEDKKTKQKIEAEYCVKYIGTGSLFMNLQKNKKNIIFTAKESTFIVSQSELEELQLSKSFNVACLVEKISS